MPRGQNIYFRIYNVVRRIPKGKVATYGQVATLAGSPRASQVVGWALRALKADTKLPWHRVVNKEGIVSIENFDVPKEQQAAKLRAEGVAVDFRDGNYLVDLEHFGWRPSRSPANHR
ncbi:MAG: MGMT family protein [Patescibacteria group bacterium]